MLEYSWSVELDLAVTQEDLQGFCPTGEIKYEQNLWEVQKWLKPAFLLATTGATALVWKRRLYVSLWENYPSSHLVYYLSKWFTNKFRILITSVESSSIQYDVYFVSYEIKIEGMFYGLATLGLTCHQDRDGTRDVIREETNPLKHFGWNSL